MSTFELAHAMCAKGLTLPVYASILEAEADAVANAKGADKLGQGAAKALVAMAIAKATSKDESQAEALEYLEGMFLKAFGKSGKKRKDGTPAPNRPDLLSKLSWGLRQRFGNLAETCTKEGGSDHALQTCLKDLQSFDLFKAYNAKAKAKAKAAKGEGESAGEGEGEGDSTAPDSTAPDSANATMIAAYEALVAMATNGDDDAKGFLAAFAARIAQDAKAAKAAKAA